MRQAVQEKIRSRRTKRSGFLAAITGIAHSEETDLSSRVDDILYGPDERK
jgi:hypothetical protein